MIGQRVGDFVAHDLGKLVVGEAQLFEQARVRRHAATGHAPGVDGVVLVDNGDTPLPGSGGGIQGHRFGNQAAGNGGDAPRDKGIGRQFVGSIQFPDGAEISLARLDDRRLGRNQHELTAPGRARGTGAERRGGQQD